MVDPGCEPARQQMDALADGTLAGPAAERLRAHVAGCPACAAELAAVRALRWRLAGLSPEALPAGFAERLARRVSVAEPSRGVRLRAAAVPAATAVAGFLLAAALVSPLLTGHGGSRTAASRAASSGHAGPTVSPRANAAALFRPLTPVPAAEGATARAAVSAPEPGAGASSASAASGSAAAPLAVTLLAAEPAAALDVARARVAAAGGELSETVTPPPTTRASGTRVAGTVDALLPTAAATRLVSALRRYGTVLSTVGATAAVAARSPQTRLLVSVLAKPAAPPRARPAPRPSAALRTSLGGLRQFAAAVLADAAAAAPWAGLAAALGLLAWGVSAVWRGVRR